MSKNYKTMDAEIRNGNIIPSKPHEMPRSGKALLVVTEEQDEKKPSETELRKLLGWLETSVDSAQWQRSVRNEWEERR